MLNINQILYLKKNGITTLNQLAILELCKKEQLFGVVSKDLKISVRGIERFAYGIQHLLTVEAAPLSESEDKKGRPAKRVLLTTAKGKRILNKLKTIN